MSSPYSPNHSLASTIWFGSNGVGPLNTHAHSTRGSRSFVEHVAGDLPDAILLFENKEFAILFGNGCPVGEDGHRPLRAIEDGLNDAALANSRLQKLKAKRQELRNQIPSIPVQRHHSLPPRISVEEEVRDRKDVERLSAVEGALKEKKKLLRIWIDEIKLAPEHLEIKISFRVPEPFFMNQLVAGAFYQQIHKKLERWLVRRVTRPSKGTTEHALKAHKGTKGVTGTSMVAFATIGFESPRTTASRSESRRPFE